MRPWARPLPGNKTGKQDGVMQETMVERQLQQRQLAGDLGTLKAAFEATGRPRSHRAVWILSIQTGFPLPAAATRVWRSVRFSPTDVLWVVWLPPVIPASAVWSICAANASG